MRRALAVPLLSTAVLALAAGSAAPASAQALVGSYAVQDGPWWETIPPIYDCLEACALVFGGEASHYDCSTGDVSIDHQAFVSGWGDETYCTTPVAEDFSVGTVYDDCGFVGCSYSAYVQDHCDMGQRNYCWLPDCGNGALDAGEECDDGNLADGDCCSATCRLDPAETSCADGDLCNGGELCDGAGSCLAGTPLDCEDSDPCSEDSCDPALGCTSELAPSLSCAEDAEKASLVLDAERRKASFSWRNGSIPFADFGDPRLTTEDYAFCVYSGDPGTVLRLGAPGASLCKDDKPCWKRTGKETSPSGFAYRDKLGQNVGVRSITLKAHEAGKAKVEIGARGENLPTLDLGATGLASPVTAQLFYRYGGCWGATFEAADQKRNDASRFKATRKAAP